MTYSNSLSKPLPRYEIMKRRAQLLRIVESSKDNPTYEQLVERMLERQWVADRWPEYSVATAMRDLSYVFSMASDDVRTIANVYFVRQLGIIEEIIDDLKNIAADEEVKPHTRISALAAVGPYLDKEIRMMENYGATKINVNKTNATINLDKFLEMKQKAQDEIEIQKSNIITIEVLDDPNIQDGIIDEEE